MFTKFVEYLVADSELAYDPMLSLAAIKASTSSSCSSSNIYTVHNTHVSEYKKFLCKSNSHYVCSCENLMRTSRHENLKKIDIAKVLCWGCLRESHIKGECRVIANCKIYKLEHISFRTHFI